VVIEVNNLIRKYGSFTAVNNISFKIPKGQIVGLLGHNGAGKTTTLKMLTGYLEATSGSITIAHLNIDEHMLAVQAKIGYLPESSPLSVEMTVGEDLAYVAKMRGIPETEQAAAIRDALVATDLTDKTHSPISTLSKGYRQRVGVAQAIVHKPEILILDEPTNGLDPTQILAMRHLIKNLSKTSTVIISTHIMQEVEAICDRVLIILHGRLVVDSLLADLQKDNTITVGIKEQAKTVTPVLTQVQGVRTINQVASNADGVHLFAIEADKNALDIAPMIAKTIFAQGWDLYSLTREQRNLESVFKEVNKVSTRGAAHA
jgi:ABC-2 type transport system ATP-binding protein